MLQKMKRTLSVTALAAAAALITACGGGNGFDGEYKNDRVDATMIIDGQTFTMIERGDDEEVLEAARIEITENDDGSSEMVIFNDKDREMAVLVKSENGIITVKGFPGSFEPAS